METVAVTKKPEATQPAWALSKETQKLFDEIQQRAYSLFQQRGGAGGSELDDWFRAEREAFDVPASELVEDDKAFHIQAAVPGLEAKDVKVTATPAEVLIRGEKSTRNKKKDGNVHLSEFTQKSIFRRFALPSQVDVDSVKAKVENGLLTVDAPKKAPASNRNPEKKRVAPKKNGATAKRAMA